MKRFVIIFAASLIHLTAAGQSTIELTDLYQRARDADPRIRQLQIEAAQSELRLRNIESERLPVISIGGQTQYQSEVVEFPAAAAGQTPSPPNDSYELAVRFERLLRDPSRRARIETEEASLAEAQARIQTALFGLRQEINEAFFSAALLQEREAQIHTAIRDLEARLREANLRVESGTALRGEAFAIEATLLERTQSAAEMRASRLGALARLSQLTGTDFALEDRLALPQLDQDVARARADIDTLRARPEFEQFARARATIETRKDLVESRLKPRVAAYGTAAYGSPGLNFLREEFHPWWLAGVRVQWQPWTWGNNRRERELLALQQESIAAEEKAFARSLTRAVQNDFFLIGHLVSSVTLDERIVALRESIERETRARFDESVVTAAEYVDRETDVLDARLLRATHRVQLAQAQARLLTLLGLEVH